MKKRKEIYDPYNLLMTEKSKDAIIKPNGDIYLPMWTQPLKIGAYHLTLYIAFLKKVHYRVNITEALEASHYRATRFPYDYDITLFLTLSRGNQSYFHHLCFPDVSRLAAYVSQITGDDIPYKAYPSYFNGHLPITRSIHDDEAIDIRPTGSPAKLSCSSCEVMYDPKSSPQFPWQISISNYYLPLSIDGKIGDPISTRNANWKLTNTSIYAIMFVAAEAASRFDPYSCDRNNL